MQTYANSTENTATPGDVINVMLLLEIEGGMIILYNTHGSMTPIQYT